MNQQQQQRQQWQRGYDAGMADVARILRSGGTTADVAQWVKDNSAPCPGCVNGDGCYGDADTYCPNN